MKAREIPCLRSQRQNRAFGHQQWEALERRRKQQNMDELISEASRGVGPVRPGEDAPPWFPSVSALVESVGRMPLLQANDAHMVMGFEDQLQALVEAVDSAERYVHVEFYITIRDATTTPFFDALRRAVDRAVTVRLLLDHMGTRPYPGYRTTLRALTEMGRDDVVHLEGGFTAWKAAGLPVQPYTPRR